MLQKESKNRPHLHVGIHNYDNIITYMYIIMMGFDCVFWLQRSLLIPNNYCDSKD